MNLLAETIKERLTMADIMTRYNIHVSASGYAVCPFHSEKTGSLRIFPGNRGWHCFGCGEGGSVIDFVEKYFRLDFRGAVIRLDTDFRLGLPLDVKPTRAEMAVLAQKAACERSERQVRENAQADAEAAYWGDLTALRMCDVLLRENRPSNQAEPWSDGFVFALLNRADLVENLKHSQTVMELTRERGRADGRKQLIANLP